ncbi:rCG55906 [Rattus norvegicus]|uniref:RCG55906 n=1 Tax=Rattus norvegicus TaxID=10116 RepID=A6JM98_RAT|nr:rCG55906 [Rattus norvegicus]
MTSHSVLLFRPECQLVKTTTIGKLFDG